MDITTVGSDGTQINTRGFGDIGMQFQDVIINAPITIVHVSSQGNNKATNTNIGKDIRNASEQDHLQSNRTDAAAPPTGSGMGNQSGQAATSSGASTVP